MAPSMLRKAIGAVKDETSIALAKISRRSCSELDVVIVKATRHDEFPADEKHVRGILSLMAYPRSNISACINTIARRLNGTKKWTVAIKALVLVQRLIAEGDPSYEQEIFFMTRNGTRLLKMSDFRDTSTSNSWDFSAFARTYALYLDEKLQHRMLGRQGMFGGDEEEGKSTSEESRRVTPLRERKIEKIFSEMQQSQQLLDRFLACRPTGEAKNNQLVCISLYPIVKESFQIHGEMSSITSELIDRSPALNVSDCMKVYDIFSRAKKQLEDLESFYGWCKHVGIARTSDYTEVEAITQKKLDLMDEFIREKKATEQRESSKSLEEKEPTELSEQDMVSLKALPPLDGFDETTFENQKVEQEAKKENPVQEPDLIDLGFDQVDQGENLPLVLFGNTNGGPPEASAWESFSEIHKTADWESALVQSASELSNQNTKMGGGFNDLVLNGMYQHSTMSAINANTNLMGSASSIAYGSDGRSLRMLNNFTDPFTPSFTIAPSPYILMSDLGRRQRLLMEEQLMWQQYARDGMEGQLGQAQWQANHYTMGGYSYQRSCRGSWFY